MASMTRREAIGAIGAATVGVRVAGSRVAAATPGLRPSGQLVQSVCRWCYQDVRLTDFFQQVTSLGLTAVDLLEADEWVAASDLRTALLHRLRGGRNGPAWHQRSRQPRRDRTQPGAQLAAGGAGRRPANCGVCRRPTRHE